MPKGVEHHSCDECVIKHFSVDSLMPKGVEHQENVAIASIHASSVESLMPKGVEHWDRDCDRERVELC